MSQLTPYQVVRETYDLPFELYDWQQEDVNFLAPIDRTGLYWDPGLGKTAGSTHCSLYKKEVEGVDTVLYVLPPILIPQWYRWLNRIKRKDGRHLKVVMYRGTPLERQSIKLQGDFILMSLPIFKLDFERIFRDLHSKKVMVCVDEAHSLKNVTSANYKTVRDYTLDKALQLMTGTPLNKPLDAYAYTKLTNASAYRTLAQFTNLHVNEKDFFDNPISYKNLDLLQENLFKNAVRRTKDDVLNLPPCTIVPIEYDLSPQHLKLYQKVVADELVKLDEDTKIDLTSASALFHALGQIPMNWGHFAGDESKLAAGFELIDEVLDELGDKKLIIFANYKMTNRLLTSHYKCGGVWSEINAGQKQRNIDRFIDDPRERLLVMHSASGGAGVEGLQHVCTDILYMEPPITPTQFTQSLSRVQREGQTKPTTIRLATAIGTIQVRQALSLAKNEAMINPLQLSKSVLRDLLLGGTGEVSEVRQKAA